MNHHLKAIIFDLDGTLLYTLPDIADAMNSALAELNISPIPETEYRWLVGGGAEDVATRVLPLTMRTPAEISAFVERFRYYYRQNWHAKTTPYEGIPELIAYLRQNDYRIGILSNKPQEFTENIVNHFFHSAGEVFQPVWGQRSGIPVKPDPGSALEIATLWKLLPAEIGFMGDSDVDILTAQNSGMVSIGAEWGFRGREELLSLGTNVMLSHPLDLIPQL